MIQNRPYDCFASCTAIRFGHVLRSTRDSTVAKLPKNLKDGHPVMILRSFRRSSRSRYIRAFGLILAILCAIDLLYLSWIRQVSYLEPTYDEPKKTSTIYIASIHWNNENVLRSNWTTAVLDLAEAFGPENVYISILESGSWDDSKGALEILDNELEKIGVQRTILLEPKTHADEIAASPSSSGWIDTPRGKKELRRIPYLSRLRNISLKPLADLALKGRTFDRVLFLNDVVFTVSIGIELHGLC